MEITELLAFAQKHQSSDIHLSSEHPPLLRVNGDIHPLRVPKLSADEVRSMLYSIMTEKQRSEFEEHFECDFAVHFGDSGRFRVNAFTTLNGPAAVLRTVPAKVLSLKDISAPKIFYSLTKLSRGMVLITGPTGSGKTTTVSAMLDHMNKNMSHHILTIEDPIEVVHRSDKSLVNQREVGLHSQSFARSLKSALREDPDVILVGELRDLETIHSAITAAETGHLVLGTLHTSSAAQTIDRIIDVFPSDDKAMIRTMLSNSLEGVIAQKLIKKRDGSGRVPVYEVLTCTPAVRNLIREGKIPQIHSLMQVGSRFGMQIMKDSIFNLMNEGVITNESAKEALNDAGDSNENEDGEF